MIVDTTKTHRQLNIAMLGHKRIPSREGGVEVVVQELATRMAAMGHTVTCYNRKGHHVSGVEYDGKRLSEFSGVILKDVPTINYRGLAAVTSSFTASILAGNGSFDVVHYHAEGPCIMCWLPKLRGKRVVVTIHGLDHQRAKWGPFGRLCILVGEKFAVRCADEIIVLSLNVQQYFRNRYGRETTFIPNGVTRPQICPAQEISERYGLQKDEYILSLGRIVPEKGVHYLIEAYKSVDTNRKLVIAGGCSDSKRYMKRIQDMAREDDRVIFTDFVQGQVLEELYSNAYMYVLPSDLEGMPLSLLEAMSYGNCCLVSNIPECTEVVEDHAAVFEHGNVADLAARMQELCDQPEMVTAFRRDATDFICEKYNWDNVAEQTLALYAR